MLLYSVHIFLILELWYIVQFSFVIRGTLSSLIWLDMVIYCTHLSYWVVICNLGSLIWLDDLSCGEVGGTLSSWIWLDLVIYCTHNFSWTRYVEIMYAVYRVVWVVLYIKFKGFKAFKMIENVKIKVFLEQPTKYSPFGESFPT